MTPDVALSPVLLQQLSARGPALMLEAWQSGVPLATHLISPRSCDNIGEKTSLPSNLRFRLLYMQGNFILGLHLPEDGFGFVTGRRSTC